MSWLTGKEILKQTTLGKITIQPLDTSSVNPNSYDYHLAPNLKILLPNSNTGKIKFLDPKKPSLYKDVKIGKNGYILMPGVQYLGHTVEVFGSTLYASLCTGKSSIGRLFIHNHICAGLIDIGFLGHITLEIICQIPVRVYPNMRFGQIFWFTPEGNLTQYSGKYTNGNAAQPSLIYQDLP